MSMTETERALEHIKAALHVLDQHITMKWTMPVAQTVALEASLLDAQAILRKRVERTEAGRRGRHAKRADRNQAPRIPLW